MAYTRQPQSVLAGTALVQNPPASIVQPAGIVPVTLDCEIATTAQLGVIQVGNGLTITPLGVLSAQNASLVSVKLTGVTYSALATDYYIGTTTAGITITLPLGVVGKIYVVKNQVNGNITVTGTGGQKLDTANTKQLGTNDSITVVFDGTRWNIITS